MKIKIGKIYNLEYSGGRLRANLIKETKTHWIFKSVDNFDRIIDEWDAEDVTVISKKETVLVTVKAT